MYDDDSKVLLDIQYVCIQNLLIEKGRYPTREEVVEAMVVSMDDHSQPNVVRLQ